MEIEERLDKIEKKLDALDERIDEGLDEIVGLIVLLQRKFKI